VLVKLAVAVNVDSCPPCTRGILNSNQHTVAMAMQCEMKTHFHMTTFSAGTYFALPLATLLSTVVVFRGVGIRKMTSVADSLLLKFALTEIVYDTCVVPISVTLGMIRSGSLTFEVDR
jgi:hypothetical protein